MTRIQTRGVAGGAAACVSAVLLAACAASPPGGFSAGNARAHVNMLGGTIGIRPVGTDANRRAREYIVSELARSGFDVHVQETDAVRPEAGRTAHVFNIVAVSAGRRPDAVALVSHYDSVPAGPGAADAGLGVARFCSQSVISSVLPSTRTPPAIPPSVSRSPSQIAAMGTPKKVTR